MIKVHIIHTGKVQVDDAIPHGSRNHLAVTGILRGKDKKRILPVSSYFIQHPKGKVLIDTSGLRLVTNAKNIMAAKESSL